MATSIIAKKCTRIRNILIWTGMMIVAQFYQPAAMTMVTARAIFGVPIRLENALRTTILVLKTVAFEAIIAVMD